MEKNRRKEEKEKEKKREREEREISRRADGGRGVRCPVYRRDGHKRSHIRSQIKQVYRAEGRNVSLF